MHTRLIVIIIIRRCHQTMCALHSNHQYITAAVTLQIDTTPHCVQVDSIYNVHSHVVDNLQVCNNIIIDRTSTSVTEQLIPFVYTSSDDNTVILQEIAHLKDEVGYLQLYGLEFYLSIDNQYLASPYARFDKQVLQQVHK